MSKTKGNAGERELCGKLKNIFGGSFIRVPNSGAFTGGLNAYRKVVLSKAQVRNSKGDIIPPDFMPKLVIESKYYKEFRFAQLLRPEPCPQLDEWIGQALEAADQDDLWFVCFKINRLGWFVVIPPPFITYRLNNHAQYTGEHGTFVVTQLDGFLTDNKAEILDQSK